MRTYCAHVVARINSIIPGINNIKREYTGRYFISSASPTSRQNTALQCIESPLDIYSEWYINWKRRQPDTDCNETVYMCAPGDYRFVQIGALQGSHSCKQGTRVVAIFLPAHGQTNTHRYPASVASRQKVTNGSLVHPVIKRCSSQN